MAKKLDRGRLGRDREDKKKGGGSDLFRLEDGRTLLYIMPPTDAMDGLPYLEYETHFGITPEGKGGAPCLEASNDPVWHPLTQEHLAKRKIKLSKKDGCPVEQAVAGEIAVNGYDRERKQDRVKAKRQFIFGVVPWARLVKKGGVVKRIPFSEEERVPRPMIVGWTVWDGICEQVEVEGDITDPAAAMLVRVTKSGKGLDTEYSVGMDSTSVRKPIKLPKVLAKAVDDALEEGGDCDPFRLLANFIRPPHEVLALMKGEDLIEEDSDDEPAPKAVPKAAAEDEDDDEEFEDDDDDEEFEDDDELDDDEEDEEDEVEPEPAAEPEPAKANPVDDFEAELKARRAKRRKRKGS